eukprot:3359620-Rhodomonas_salina.1
MCVAVCGSRSRARQEHGPGRKLEREKRRGDGAGRKLREQRQETRQRTRRPRDKRKISARRREQRERHETGPRGNRTRETFAISLLDAISLMDNNEHARRQTAEHTCAAAPRHPRRRVAL